MTGVRRLNGTRRLGAKVSKTFWVYFVFVFLKRLMFLSVGMLPKLVENSTYYLLRRVNLLNVEWSLTLFWTHVTVIFLLMSYPIEI